MNANNLFAKRNQTILFFQPQFDYIGCVRLASLGRPRCVTGFFPRTNVGNYLHTFVLEKNNAIHRGRPREAKRTHP